jgi:hypothetical protein
MRITKGFNPLPKLGTRYLAIELNKEDLDSDEVIDVLELHHLTIDPIKSKRDLAIIERMSDAICGGFSVISPVEFLAVIYTMELNDHALELGANVARTYHNSHPGDNRIRANSIAHIFEDNYNKLPLPVIATKLVAKYINIYAVVDGTKVTLSNRLGS